MALNAAIIAITIVIWLIVVFITRAIFRATIFRDAHRLGTGLSEATIARDLGPLFDRYITRDSKIWITGSDGTPLYRLLYPWHRRLKRWLRRGCKIDYLLIEPSPRGKKAFADLARRFGEQLRVFVVDSADEVAESNSASFQSACERFIRRSFKTPVTG